MTDSSDIPDEPEREVAGRQSSPLTGKLSARPAGKPGDFLIVIGAFATIPSPPLPDQFRLNTEAPQYAFSKEGRNLSVRCGFKPKPKQSQNQIPGREPTASRWSAPSPGKRTRREDHALLIVRDEFRTGYSSIGLLASRARLRFTGIAIIKLWTARRKRIIIER
jgi:hypothetical protein